jgi:hypothetical protein
MPPPPWTARRLWTGAVWATTLVHAATAAATYDVGDSITSDVLGTTFIAAFADGSQLEGELASDAVRLGSWSAGDATIGLGYAYVGTWHHSGILGLGVQGHSTLASLCPAAADRKFAIALRHDGGALYLGAAASNPTALGTAPPIFALPIATAMNDYSVRVSDISLGGQPLLPAASSTICHVDSGASTLTLPKSAFQLFAAAVTPLTTNPPSLFVNISGVGRFEIPLGEWDLGSAGGVAVSR